MTRNFAIAALLSVLAIPAVANNVNPGDQMQAELLGLDPSRFTASDLAPIASEDAGKDRESRIRLIEAQKGGASF